MNTPQIEVDDASPRNTPSHSDVEDNPQSSPGYHPDRSPSSQLAATLSGRTPLRRKRDGDGTTLSSSCKKAVDQAGPNPGRCLVTCAPVENAVLTRCHLLPQCSRYNHGLLTKLERAWGLRHDTLHVDTHFNIMLLWEDWHKLFDLPRWFLLPSMKVVKLLDQRREKGLKAPIHELYDGENIFEYRLILMTPNIDNIFRYDWPEAVDPPPDLNSVDFTRHKHPFATLPTLRSHVQPHFVVYNFGLKTERTFLTYPQKIALSLGISIGEASDLLIMLVRIYQSWVDDPAEASETKGSGPRRVSFGARSEDDDDSSSPSRFSKRSRHSAANSGSRAQVQGGGQNNTQLMLRRAANPSIAITPELDYDGTDRDTETVSHSSSNELDMQVDSEPIQHVSVLAWANLASSAAASEGWERITVNDKQLGRYPEELAHPLQL